MYRIVESLDYTPETNTVVNYTGVKKKKKDYEIHINKRLSIPGTILFLLSDSKELLQIITCLEKILRRLQDLKKPPV